MTQRNGIKQIIIIASAGLIINIGVGIWNSVGATNQNHFQVRQNVKDIENMKDKLNDKADAERIGEVMELMNKYHEVAMKAIETNDKTYKAEMDRINKRIDDLLSKYNAMRGGTIK